jgi:hypothetical protein
MVSAATVFQADEAAAQYSYTGSYPRLPQRRMTTNGTMPWWLRTAIFACHPPSIWCRRYPTPAGGTCRWVSVSMVL